MERVNLVALENVSNLLRVPLFSTVTRYSDHRLSVLYVWNNTLLTLNLFSFFFQSNHNSPLPLETANDLFDFDLSVGLLLLLCPLFNKLKYFSVLIFSGMVKWIKCHLGILRKP